MMDSESVKLLLSEEAAECAQFMVSSEPWVTLKVPLQGAVSMLSDPNREVYAVHDDRGVAGFVVIDMRGLVCGYIQILCVRPDRRGQGVGSKLIAWAEKRISRDSPNAFICVSSFNTGARRLYERLGFEVVGVLRGLIVPEHDEFLLRKTRGSWSEFRKSG
jgi:ribosomal protein S18 acetylase RimI-like enzyme